MPETGLGGGTKLAGNTKTLRQFFSYLYLSTIAIVWDI
ncbi:MAG: hypothetical protein FD134_283 [Gallionellaceae bacterium]|nr:MAG: hypothetical protein FD134_283 [Gallionellaceae bacterium]